MFSLLQSVNIRGSAGVPLPNPFESLKAKGVNLLRGQLALIASGPGTGKSAFTLNWALKAAVPTMYFSADSDAFVQSSRAISVLTGRTMVESAKMVLGRQLSPDVVHELSGIPVRFNYSASPTLDDVQLSIESYEEVYGDYPSLVVVDNITNVIGDGSDGEDPFSGLESLADYLATMARDTEAAVVGLHHVTGSYNDADKPIPLSGVKGQITRVPAMVLTLHKIPGNEWEDDTLCVSAVKGRSFKADPSGADFTRLRFDGPRMQIEDITTAEN